MRELNFCGWLVPLLHVAQKNSSLNTLSIHIYQSETSRVKFNTLNSCSRAIPNITPVSEERT